MLTGCGVAVHNAEHGAAQPRHSPSQDFKELLGPAETRLLGARARSASDAAVLRRKGHLKEQV